MKFYKEDYSEVGITKWDEIVTGFNGAISFSCTSLIEYFCALSSNILNCSFIVYDDRKNVVSVCSIFATKGDIDLALPSSIIALNSQIRSEDRRRLLRFIFSKIDSILEINKCKTIDFLTHPLDNNSINNGEILSKNIFELQIKCSISVVHNTLISNLTNDYETLFQNLNKYRRRLIRKSIKKGLTVKVYNQDTKDVSKCVEDMKLAHYTSAGRCTRPDRTWEIMLNIVVSGKASIFVAFNDDAIPISYLYCGEINDMAWGWSQVPISEYEQEWSPRALLEWHSMLYYRDIGYKFYEIGERFYENAMYMPTKKEIGISEFKERYGVPMYPKIHWRYSLLNNEL